MEYRAYLKIPGLAFADEPVWEPLIQHLEREHADLGPVIGFGEGVAEVVVSMDCASEADAARRGVQAVSDSLRAVGHGELYPGNVEVELAADDELARA